MDQLLSVEQVAFKTGQAMFDLFNSLAYFPARHLCLRECTSRLVQGGFKFAQLIVDI